MGRILVLVPFVLAACAQAEPGPPAGPGAPAGEASGAVGRVVAFPTCPVEIASSPCPRKGVQTDVVFESANGERIDSVRTRPDGTFRIALAPGDYLVSARPPPAAPDLVPRPGSATVMPGTFVRVTVVLDTRLREP